MSDRQFKDCDGDTWTEYEPGMLRFTQSARSQTTTLGCTASIEDVNEQHGPLTEIRPDVDVRALLAGVLEELVEELTRTTDLPGVLRRKALELREGSA
ncbi:hypothetical protein OG912_32375 [Streptomyces sp. NBC_00464]|uniref:hypothetical protein n=1 Tax=Streptomyces sp. NBC_00464 TaxID=2975751 RepID=UPI002E194BA4